MRPGLKPMPYTSTFKWKNDLLTLKNVHPHPRTRHAVAWKALVGKFKSESWRITKGVNQLNQQQEIVFFKGGLHGDTHLLLDSQRVRTEEPMNMLGLGLKGPCGLISGLKVKKAFLAQTVGSGCKRPLWLKLWFQGSKGLCGLNLRLKRPLWLKLWFQG